MIIHILLKKRFGDMLLLKFKVISRVFLLKSVPGDPRGISLLPAPVPVPPVQVCGDGDGEAGTKNRGMGTGTGAGGGGTGSQP